MLKQLYQFCLERLAGLEGELFRASRQENDVLKFKGKKAVHELARAIVFLTAGIKYIFFQFLLALVELAVLVVMPPKEGYELIIGHAFRDTISESSEIRSRKIVYEEYERKHKKARWVSLASFSAAVAAVVAVSLVVNLILPITPSVLGATNTFTQTNWGGGSSSNNAIHPTNQSAWSQYSSASSEITVVNGGEDLELVPHSASSTQTTDTQFNGGTFSSATTTGSGSSASVKLSKALHINEYTIGASTTVASITASSVTTNSNGIWTVAFSGTPNLSRLFKNDKFTDSASRAWKVLSVAPSVYKIIVVDSEGNTPAVSAPVTGSGTVGRWYASISAWEAGRQGDITATGRNAIERGLPYYDGAADTTSVSINGWTTDATHYIEIYVPLSERHRGKWDANKYRLDLTEQSGIVIYENYVRIDGLQVSITSTQYDLTGIGVPSNVLDNTAEIKVSNNIIKASFSSTAIGRAIRLYDTNTATDKVLKAWNNTIYDFVRGANGQGIYVGGDTNAKGYIYNNTVYNTYIGYYQQYSSVYTAKNNIYQSNGISGADGYTGSFASSDYNLSDLASDASGANSKNATTTPFVATSTQDFHLEFRDGAGNPAMNAGTSTVTEIGFTTDIDGDTRSAPWDIGADDVGATLVMTHSIGTASRDFSTLQAWEDARDGVLTTRNVFKISGQSAAFSTSTSEVITGLTSNATGTYVIERATPSASETYMSLDDGGGIFQVGEVVQGSISNATATISAILTTAGTIEKGEAYKDSTFTAGVTIDGNTTNSTHYMWLTAEPGSRHTGVAGTGARIYLSNGYSPHPVGVLDDNTVIEWLEIERANQADQHGIDLGWSSTDSSIRNNLIHANNTSEGRGIATSIDSGNSQIFNNIVYGFGLGIRQTRDYTPIYYYNNTLYGNGNGFYNDGDNGTTYPTVKNHIVVGNTSDFITVNAGSWNAASSNNISSDATAPGATGSLTNKSVSDLRFVSTASDFVDLHILDGSAAKDAGADLSATFTGDIDPLTGLEQAARPAGSAWDIGADEWFSSSPVYNTSGTFTSATIDFGNLVNFSSIAWNPTTQATSTTLNFRIATSSDGTTWNSPYVGSDGTANTYFATSGAATPSILNGNRYIRYRAYLSITDSAFTPQLDDVTVNYTYYATSSPYLTSSPYNSNDATNILGKISWTATTTTGTEARIQVRSAPNSGGVPGTWSQWCGYTACDDADYFATSTNNVDLASGHPLKNGGNDQWLQYKINFISDGSATPTFGDITLTYIVNAPPDLQNVTASQRTSDGKVDVVYEVRDTDTATGTTTPGLITPSFSYSTDGGLNWTAITSGYLTAGNLSNKQVCDGTGTYGLNCAVTQYTQYTATWDAKAQLNGTYATNTKIMITTTDNEGANNSSSVATSAFTLDVKNPVVTMTVDGTKDGQAGAVATSITDNSSALMMLSNLSNYSADGLNGSSGTWIATSTSLTWNFAAGDPVRVYAKVKDAYQNETAVAPDAPNTPANATIQDTSNLNLSEFREFVSWSVNAAGDFGSYKVYRSTDGSSYSLLSTIASAATNYLEDGSSGAWLSNGTTYYYKLTAQDSAGNISRYSSAVSDIPDGQGGTDVTPPTISGLSSSAINTTQATITWTTDELSNSVVYYSTDSSYSSSKTVASMVTAHSATLTGLTPNTAYNFRVRSTDPLSNVSSYATGTPFTTSQGPVISGVTTVAVSGNSATVVWNTNTDSSSYVVFSTNSDLSGSQTAGTSTLVGGSGPNYEHRVSLSSLSTNAKYYFKVRSVDGSSNSAEDDNGGSYYTFTTAQDVSAPVISSVSAILSSQTSTVISWLTNEPADSQVVYGLDQNSLTSQTAVNSTMTINHSMILSDLTAGATYYYKVVSADSSANSTQSAVYNFSTTALALENTLVVTRYVESGPPVVIDRTSPLITDVKVDGITESEATITWRTNEEADSFVEYGSPDILGFTRGQRESVKPHRVVLMDLKPNARYAFKATSADASGNVSVSLVVNFQTLSQKTVAEKIGDQIEQSAREKIKDFKIENQDDIARLTKEIEEIIAQASSKVAPPRITGADPKVEVSSSFAVISWVTDRPASSVVAYAPLNDYAPGNEDPYKAFVGSADEQVTEHRVVLSDLAPGATYHYQVRSKGLIGGVGKSGDYTFKTTEEGSISGVEIKEITKDSAVIFWRTNIPATTLLNYGMSTSYGLSQFDPALNVSHTAILRNLQPGTFYHFKIGGTDKNDSTIASPDLTFTTESLPSMLNVKIDAVKEREMTVTWYTDVLSDSTVEYTNLKTGKAEAFSDKQMVRNHTLAVTGLEEDAPYKFRAVSRDEKGNEVKSSEYNLQTTRDREPPEITNIQTQSAVSGKDRVQTIVSWRTSEPSSSRVTYQEGVVKNPELERSSPFDNDLKMSHVVVFTDLKPGAVYRLKIESVDAANNAAQSRDLTILTPQRKETVIDLIIKNFQDVFRWTEKMR